MEAWTGFRILKKNFFMGGGGSVWLSN